MRYSLLFAAMLLSCSRESAGPVEAARLQPDAKTHLSEIVLNAEQQKQGHLVLIEAALKALPLVISASGRLTVNENHTYSVGAITEGRLVRVLVNPGDRVERGQMLAGMHSHDIHESRAEYRKALAELDRLKAVLAYAQRQRDRASRLYELKAGSLQQVEQAETELENARVAVTNAETDVTRTRLHLVEFLHVSPVVPHEHESGDSEHDGDLIPVTAPASGTVLTRNISAGSVANAGDELFVISDLSSIWMIAALPEQYLAKVRNGMAVHIHVQAYGEREFPGRITRIGDELDPQTRTVPVRVELPNSHFLLKPEMYVTADVEAGRTESGLFVPQEAVQQVEAKSTVFVQAAPDRFEARTVETGRSLDGMLEILGGLRTGEKVVAQGSYLLKSQLLKATMGEE